jgi:hypothetical protein
VRWYAPVFVLTGLGVAAAGRTLFRLPGDARGYVRLFLAAGFLAVVAVQTAAPYPYEDYQVPAMGLAAVVAAALCLSASGGREGPARPFFFALLALGLSWSASFGSPLLERWTTDGADRFWTLRKEESELARLRRTAAAIEALDPGGKDLLTQDLYLAVEARRRVPDGLEMGPFSILSDESWRRILATTPCRVAALSGYSFAIDPPRCGERPIARQLEFWTILKKRYDIVMREERFGQNATPLLVLRLKDGAGGKEAGR